MKKPVIAVDIDDVLADSAKVFVEWSNKKYSTKLTIEDYDEHWAKIWQVDNDEIEKRAMEYNNSDILMAQEHIPSARNVLEKLEKRFKFIIITSRRLQAKDGTISWINKYYPGLFSDIDINFAGMWDIIDDNSICRTKGEISKKLGADYLIDDQLKHCLSATEFGIRALLFGDYSWNRNDKKLPDNVTRVKNWYDVEQYFNKQR